MFRYECDVSRKVRKVIAVSDSDAALIQDWYRLPHVEAVPTGVDAEYFKPGPPVLSAADLVFVGSMDWAPNIDGIDWFQREVLPLLLRRKPDCTIAIVGRRPPRSVQQLAEQYPGVQVTGTVPDVRPWLWSAKVSIVPLRIGGGTRLKIFEAMAAGIPVVSTAVGAEGLGARDGETIRIADSPEAFAESCVALLDDAAERKRLSDQALEMITRLYSWDAVATAFENALNGPASK